ncbi:MAG: phosphoribosylformylglycinamidine synthase subunit PurL [Candidatus Omnitrophica bacterium]|nr:phosphoribosylformylglycinamidine synthase subunit PurL [Candidatus Omnitrophota bacterium]
MITQEMYEGLGLKESEYKRILELLGRQPTLTELAMFSVEWSEHCGYCRSRRWLKILPKTGKFKSLVGEDSGGIIVDDIAIIFKAESHNHPSQVEPKQGAATGVGGIIRDIFTAGARPIASLDSLRFGTLDEPYSRYLLKGVVDGIQFYGNCVGVPTVGGEVYFNKRYSGNCLVNVMCIGVAPKDKLARAKAVAGGIIMYVGSSTGKDGIGGCSVLASAEFAEGEEKRPTVQIGDPFTEKCLIEATLETISTGHVLGIKDMGAAGLTCSISEMAQAGGTGMDIDLDKVPTREREMQPWEIMMSESQERMLVCIKEGKEEEIEKIFSKWGLNAAVLGKATIDGIVRIKAKNEVVAEIKADFLAEAPLYEMPHKKPDYQDELNYLDLDKIVQPRNLGEVLIKLLSSPNITNKNWIYHQYDHMVQVNTMVLPGSDAAVLRIKGTNKAIAATTDCNAKYCELNPLRGAQIAIAEAARNLVCSGAEPAAVTDCLNFANPEKPQRYWYFKNCVEGITEACQFFGVSVVSGNVSFYNESPLGAILPTPMIGMIGIVSDIKKVCTQGFKNENEAIILLGKNLPDIGGSEYLEVIHNQFKGQAPYLDLSQEKALHDTVLKVIKDGLVQSAHDCSEGGLAAALAECCLSNSEKITGALIDNLDFDIRKDFVLFAESQSRVILSASFENVPKIKEIAGNNTVPFKVIGKTGGDSLKILDNDKELINLKLDKLKSVWYESLEESLNSSS